MDKEIKLLAEKNDKLNSTLVRKFIVFSNVWMTLVAPIGVGFFISYSFSNADWFSIPMMLLIFIFLGIHLFLAYIQSKSTKKHHTYSQVTKLCDHLNTQIKTYNDLRLSHQYVTDLNIAQVTTLFLISAELDKAVGDLNNEMYKELDSSSKEEPLPLHNSLDVLMDKHLTNLLWPLIVNKGDLFSYQEPSLYNIALYRYDEKSDRLKVVKRFHDERIPIQNRDWKPGIGHVGMTFLNKVIKCCPNIQDSTELTDESERDSKYYCSFISVPILACEDNERTDNNPHGVLVLTSAMENQFSLRRDQFFLQAISKMLAVYFDKQDHAHKLVSAIKPVRSEKQ